MSVVAGTMNPELSLKKARQVMQQQGLCSPNQQMGLRWSVGCVALEITQRCNLDCTLCYLSDHSEAVHDIPLQEIFKRIDRIHQYYGDYTDIQVTGGDPTLRDQDELVEIIDYIRRNNMRSTLMTNGIRATRPLLQRLARAGLNDVAFHVDLTQERKGYNSEQALNRIRSEYINRTRGLGLSVVFNTTVCRENFHEIPQLVRFFIEHAQNIRTASFQLQADTGRGVQRQRDTIISTDTVWQKIEQVAGTEINFRAIRTGHPQCNRYGMTVVTNDRCYNLFDDADFTGRMQAETRNIVADRNRAFTTALQLSAWLIRHPLQALEFIKWSVSKLLQMRADLYRARGKASSLSFFVHNFMDACNLDQERLDACVFKNMTPSGPVSMCEYNARRDEYILQPVTIKQEREIKFWNPLSGEMDQVACDHKTSTAASLPQKKMKGRVKAVKLRETV